MSNTKNLDFTERVRSIVTQIPRGQVLSYSMVAAQAGKPKAARAVARIMSANFDPHIPCHRVIRNDGTLGGYNRGGTDEKRALLKSEGWDGLLHVTSR